MNGSNALLDSQAIHQHNWPQCDNVVEIQCGWNGVSCWKPRCGGRKWPPSEKGGAEIWAPSLLLQAFTGVIQSLHSHLRLKRHWFRLVTETGTGKKNLVSDYRGIKAQKNNCSDQPLTAFCRRAWRMLQSEDLLFHSAAFDKCLEFKS